MVRERVEVRVTELEMRREMEREAGRASQTSRMMQRVIDGEEFR